MIPTNAAGLFGDAGLVEKPGTGQSNNQPRNRMSEDSDWDGIICVMPEPDGSMDNLLFDDHSILEQALGKAAFQVSQINPNCDCSAYYSLDHVEPPHSDTIAASAAPAC